VLLDALREAAFTLARHRLRTVLTMFGVFWGTASVVFLMAWGDGLAQMLEQGFTKVGRDLGLSFAGRVGEQYRPVSDRRQLSFSREDVAALRRLAHGVGPVAGETLAWSVVSHRQRTLTMDVRGIEDLCFSLRVVTLAAGRRITRSEVAKRRAVAVLGAKARRRLLGGARAVGAQIRIDGRPFEVIGVLREIGPQLWRDRSDIDDQVWVPITALAAAQDRASDDEPLVDYVLFRFPGWRRYPAARQEVRRILSRRLRVSAQDAEAVYVVSATETLRQIPIEQIQSVLLALAVATLGIGGVGVMSMMLDAVQQRRAEIGLRRAVGARRYHIVLQFMLETAVLLALGGTCGILCGSLGALGLEALGLPDLVPVPVLRLSIVVTALGVMTAIGVLAGVLPALRAARVEPASILRTE
jgi:putative ABC transport system permease protein